MQQQTASLYIQKITNDLTVLETVIMRASGTNPLAQRLRREWPHIARKSQQALHELTGAALQ